MPLSAQGQVGLDRFKVAFDATAHLSFEELERLRRARSRQACLPLRSAPKPLPRDQQPRPRPSRQYQRPTATLHLRDRRLPDSATRLAGMIVALAGRRGWCEVTRARLGGTIGKSRRTITRRLADLIRLGYIAVERTKTRTGSDAGLRIVVLPPLLAYFLAGRGGWPKMAGDASSFRNRKTGGWQAAGDFAQHAPRDPPDRGKG